MHITVRGHRLYAYSGTKPFDPAKPSVVFIHGVLNDHSVWVLQSRYFAHHGWNVLAIDLPGHGRSEGDPPQSVDEAAAWIPDLLDALGIARAALVGHSFGSLIALQVAASAPDRVSHLVMVGTAYPMRVSPALLEASLNEPAKAIEMVNVFSHATLAPPPSALGPGTWTYGASRALMHRVLRSNRQVNVFHRGFVACDSYRGGEAAMAAVRCPTLFILGREDAMTPPKAAQTLQSLCPSGRTVLVKGGHQMMIEAPDAVLDGMRGFLLP